MGSGSRVQSGRSPEFASEDSAEADQASSEQRQRERFRHEYAGCDVAAEAVVKGATGRSGETYATSGSLDSESRRDAGRVTNKP